MALCKLIVNSRYVAAKSPPCQPDLLAACGGFVLMAIALGVGGA